MYLLMSDSYISVFILTTANFWQCSNVGLFQTEATRILDIPLIVTEQVCHIIIIHINLKQSTF